MKQRRNFFIGEGAFTGTTFDDVHEYVLNMNMVTTSKGNFFEEITYNLFLLDPILKINIGIDEIFYWRNIPLYILEELKYPAKDKGIDILIVRNFYLGVDIEYVPVQCKYLRNPIAYPTWKNLSTFLALSFGVTNKIKTAILITNAFNVCDLVKKSEMVKCILGDHFKNIPANFFDCVRNNQIKPIYDTKIILSHQQKCLDRTLVHYESKTRGHIEMACGSGKTLTAYWIDKHMNNNSTIIFVPSLSLLSQFHMDWFRQSYAENIPINYILVGSKADEDLLDNRTFLSLDTNEIQKNMSVSKIKNIVICTYQSHDKIMNIEFDFGIYDESHKTVGSADKYFANTLFDIPIKIKKRLFMTATPKIFSGKINEKIICMSDTKIYGEKIFKYSLKTAIAHKKLVDYEIITLISRDTSITKLIDKKKTTRIDDQKKEVPAQYMASAILILKNIHEGTCNHMVTYHNKISSSKIFRDLLININRKLYNNQEICIYDLSSKMSMVTRQKIMREFMESKRGILCTSKILNEGVNIPIIDSVCFVDSRDSTIDIIQSIGRALRLYPGKEKAKIFVPVLTTSDNAYDNITKILLALKTTDDRIIESFRFPNLKRASKINFRINSYVTENEIEIIDFKTWNENIFNQIHEAIDEYPSMIKNLKMYVEKNNCLPDGRCVKLYKWCNDIRRKYFKGKLNEECIHELRSIKGWMWYNISQWIAKMNNLVKQSAELATEWEIIAATSYDVNNTKDYILYKNTKIHVVKDNDKSWFELGTILKLFECKDYECVVKNMIDKKYVKIWENVSYILLPELHVLVSKTTSAKVFKTTNVKAFKNWLFTEMSISNICSNVQTYACKYIMYSDTRIRLMCNDQYVLMCMRDVMGLFGNENNEKFEAGHKFLVQPLITTEKYVSHADICMMMNQTPGNEEIKVWIRTTMQSEISKYMTAKKNNINIDIFKDADKNSNFMNVKFLTLVDFQNVLYGKSRDDSLSNYEKNQFSKEADYLAKKKTGSISIYESSQLIIFPKETEFVLYMRNNCTTERTCILVEIKNDHLIFVDVNENTQQLYKIQYKKISCLLISKKRNCSALTASIFKNLAVMFERPIFDISDF